MHESNHIAIVINRMVKSGTQRWVLEILKAHKNFDLENESKIDLILINNQKSEWDDYIEDTINCGVRVIHLQYKTIESEKFGYFSRYISGFSRRTYERIVNKACIDHLKEYKCIVFFEIFLLETMEMSLKNWCTNIVLHVTEHQVQRNASNPIRNLKGDNVRLVFFDQNQVKENSFSKKRNKKTNYLISELAISKSLVSNRINKKISTVKKIRIAVYSRISPMRFIEMKIQALGIILKKIEAELYIYGYTEDIKYKNQLIELGEKLNIRDYIFFKENVISISDSIASDQPDLGWMISAGDAIGYGGIEMMAAGLPCLFISIAQEKGEVTSNPYVCNSPEDLANRSIDFLRSTRNISEEQIKFIQKNHLLNREKYQSLKNFYLNK